MPDQLDQPAMQRGFRATRRRLLGIVAGIAIVIGCAGAAAAATDGEQTAVFAGGCFWGVDAVFKHVKGVTGVVSGYAGGNADTAHYEMVSGGQTGHAESVQVRFDPAKVSYQTLLQIFFTVAHDPTQLNRQGPDEGSQYRSAIFYVDPEQRRMAQDFIAEMTKRHMFDKPVVTQVVPLDRFFPAEDYHQNYLALHPYEPYIIFNDMPKLSQLKKRFPDLYR